MAIGLPVPNITPVTSVLTEAFDGVPGGSNLALPANQLDDTEARQLIDLLVDKPGLTRQRGPVQAPAGVAALPRMGTGIVMTLNPQGIAKYAVLNGDSSNGYVSVLSDDQTTWIDLAWPYRMPTNPTGSLPYRIVDAKPALGGGLLIGVSSDYGVTGVEQGIAYWYGGNKPNASLSVTIVRGSQNVTGSGFLANVVPGMFLFANTDDPYTNAYIGTVLSVNSDTSITLVKPSPHPITSKTGTFQALRGLAPRVTTGRITCDTNSTTITGGATKFKSQGVDVGTWQIYRQSDFAFVGKVASVASENSITLTANAAIAAADEAYVAIRVDADYSIINTANKNKFGWINVTYADRQWYFNIGASFDKTIRGYFSDTNDLEGVDISDFDGDWLDIVSSSTTNESVRAAEAAYNGILVFKENETFIIGGNSPSSFTVRKLEDDGALSGMSVQPYAGGVIWAGREGIHFYDGVQTTNIIALKLGDWWKETIRTLDPTKYRMWSMVNRDHYMLFLESATPPVAIVRGNVSSTPTKLTVIVNMITRAVTFATNLDIRGAIVLPAAASKQTWYLVNGRLSGESSDHAIVCDGEALFNKEGLDAVTCVGSSGPGPAFFFESKKFDAGDPVRLKQFRHLIQNYLAQGGPISVDVMLGLNDVGHTLTTTFPQSVPTWTSLHTNITTWTNLKHQYPTWKDVIQSVFVPNKVPIQEESQFLSFRLYGPPMTRLQLGPYGIAYRLLRPGRV